MDKLRGTDIDPSWEEIHGLRELCDELIEALDFMVSSFPAPEKIRALRDRCKPTIYFFAPEPLEKQQQ